MTAIYGPRDIRSDPEASQAALQVAIDAILHRPDPDLIAVKRLQWIFWRIEDFRREQGERPSADIIPLRGGAA